MTIAAFVAAARARLWPFVHRDDVAELYRRLDEAAADITRLAREKGELRGRLAAAELRARKAEVEVGRLEAENNRLIEEKARLTRVVFDARKALG